MASKGSNGGSGREQHEDDNRSRQLNPENEQFWLDRGHDSRPDDSEERQPQK